MTTGFNWETGEAQIDVVHDDIDSIAALTKEHEECQGRIDRVVKAAYEKNKTDRERQFELKRMIRDKIVQITQVDDRWLSAGGWDCVHSPTGTCWYDNKNDTLHDQCLFCALPSERK